MKRILFSLAILTTFLSSYSQTFKPTDEGSSVKFKIKNFGFNTGGTFSGLKGTIKFDESKPAEASFDVTLEANTVNTDNDARDKHLKEESYFDVKNHPQIHFVSTKVSQDGKKGNYTVTGKLTLKKETKEISFPFTAEASTGGYLFEGEFKINRRDYEIGGSSTLSDNLTVTLSVLAKKE